MKNWIKNNKTEVTIVVVVIIVWVILTIMKKKNGASSYMLQRCGQGETGSMAQSCGCTLSGTCESGTTLCCRCREGNCVTACCGSSSGKVISSPKKKLFAGLFNI